MKILLGHYPFWFSFSVICPDLCDNMVSESKKRCGKRWCLDCFVKDFIKCVYTYIHTYIHAQIHTHIKDSHHFIRWLLSPYPTRHSKPIQIVGRFSLFEIVASGSIPLQIKPQTGTWTTCCLSFILGLLYLDMGNHIGKQGMSSPGWMFAGCEFYSLQ